MSDYKEFKEIDSNNPSSLFKLNDSLVYLLGEGCFYKKFS